MPGYDDIKLVLEVCTCGGAISEGGVEALGLEAAGEDIIELVWDMFAILNLFFLFLLLVEGESSPSKMISSMECSSWSSDASSPDTSVFVSQKEDSLTTSDVGSDLVRFL